MPRIGLYAWGGPGTIRLLQVKYHAPRIDTSSFMHLYDAEFLAQARQKLGVTDMWVTYSWGFSDATEQEDRTFIVDRLENFQREQIATHAYIQGLNLVTNEFKAEDVFCRDSRGRRLPYSKGRSLTCPNNPAAVDIIVRRVEAACQEAFDGIFIDNILFGLPPFFIRRDYASFWGCSCKYCQQRFQSDYGYALPLDDKHGTQVIADYIDFRCRSVADLLHRLSMITRSAGKQFGVNLYDPLWHAPELNFGYRLSSIEDDLDYFLIENHALGEQDKIDNTHLLPLTESTTKPVFVVSYRKGIGYDSMYSQTDLEAIWTEASALNYSPCLKATEFVTQSIWHPLRIEQIDPITIMTPQYLLHNGHIPKQLRSSSRWERYLIRQANRHYSQLVTLALENKSISYLIGRSGIPVRLARTRRFYDLT